MVGPWIAQVVQILIAGVAWFTVWIQTLSSPRCGRFCDYALLNGTSSIYGWACIVVVVVSLAALIYGRARWTRHAPSIGVAVIVIGAIIAHTLTEQSLNHSPYG